MSNIERLIRKAEKAYTGAKPAVLTLTAEQGFELLFALNYSGQAEGYNHIVPAAEIRTVIATHSEEGLRAIFNLLPYDSMKVVIVDDVYPRVHQQLAVKPLSEEVGAYEAERQAKYAPEEVYEIAAREFTYDIKEATRFLERANAQEVLDSDHSLGAEILDCVEYYIVKVTFDDDRTGYLAS